MRQFFDIMLILVTSIIAVRSLHLVTKYLTNSLSDFTILLLYLFQTLPVLLDLTIGVPQYSTWFKGFSNAMADTTVCIIYDVYVMVANIGLLVVSKKQKNGDRTKCKANMKEVAARVPDFFLYCLIFSPLLQVIFSGNISSFLTYSSIGGKGLSVEFVEINSMLIILAILALMLWYFKKDNTIYRLFALGAFAFLILWISGKRYVVVTLLFSYIYLYVMEKKNDRKRINIKAVIVLCVVAVILYSIYYITSVKVISDDSFESIYASLRIDFCRDDVVKFAIWKEYIRGEHILEYPLQSVISTILMIVPRSLISWKGYPHYRYLTAALYNTDVLSIPAGMTPSILEMMIANFRYLGMPVCIIFLCWYCKKADKARTSLQRYCYAMVMMGMLSQSLDSMIVIFYMVLFFMVAGNVRFYIGKES